MADFEALLERVRQAYQGLVAGVGHPIPAWLTPPSTHVRKQNGAVAATAEPMTVGQLFEEWKVEHPLREKSLLEYGRAIDTFAQFVGEATAARSVTREQLRAFKNLLVGKPTRLSAKEAKLPLQNLIAQLCPTDSCDTISLTTIRKHLTALSSLFGWAERNGYVHENPVRGVQPPKTSQVPAGCPTALKI